MKKLTAENVNQIIEECTTSIETNVLIPKCMTYTKDVYLDFRELVDHKTDVEDLIRQTLPFFSKDCQKYEFIAPFFRFTGESDGKGGYLPWSENQDDANRLIILGMYCLIVDRPKVTTAKRADGSEFKTTSHKILSPLKPVIVKCAVKE